MPKRNRKAHHGSVIEHNGYWYLFARLPGMRPGELCAMRWEDIDATATPWVYRPATHKNEWRGQPRIICIGPKARQILAARRKPAGPCFSPMEAVREMLDAKSAAAHCHRPPRTRQSHCAPMRQGWGGMLPLLPMLPIPMLPISNCGGHIGRRNGVGNQAASAAFLP